MNTAPSSNERVILCVNSGSSSVKFALFSLEDMNEVRLAYGAVERIGLAAGRLWLKNLNGATLADIKSEFRDVDAAAHGIFSVTDDLNLPYPDATGHRVIHGGLNHTASRLVDASLLGELQTLVLFAPMHLPHAIQGIEAVALRFPNLPQVACFDTAFHRRMPQVAQRFPLPLEMWNEGVRRYGFHGLSYEYVVEALGNSAEGRLLIAHLGNDASLAAVRNRDPVDTTMGLTPAGGLMMGTRCGDLDPGVLTQLMRTKGYDRRQLDELINDDAGLLGVSGTTSDMETLLQQRDRNLHAAEAVELFCYQLRKHIGAMAAALDGLDMLVFTGGIGEHAAAVRWEVCAGLTHLGISLDPRLNAANSDTISTAGSPCTVRVIATNEDLMVARHTRNLLFPATTEQTLQGRKD